MGFPGPQVVSLHLALEMPSIIAGTASVVGFLFIFLLSRKFQIEDQLKFTENYNQETVETLEMKTYDFPIIDANLTKVRKAVKKFADGLPKGVFRTILVQEDNSIDFSQLAHILGGVPAGKYYMSRETYEIFEEWDKLIPIEMDKVQKAVDQYVKDNKAFPMLPFDPDHRVNYYQLLEGHYLASAPETVFYITDMEGLITHKKPQKKRWENG